MGGPTRAPRACAPCTDILTTLSAVRHLLWFIQNMDSAKARLDLAGVHELCEKFLHRLDDELESERKQRREGRAMSKRQEELESAKAREEQEYGKQGLRECGMWRKRTGNTDSSS